MGQCLVNSNILINDLITDKNKKILNEESQSGTQTNRISNINEINQNKPEEKDLTPLQPDIQDISNFIKDQQLIMNNQGNKVKNSVYTNFRKGNPLLNKNNNNLLESLQSKNSDILFESFSISNLDKGNNSLIIDYYQIAKNIFEILNEIRCDPIEKGKEYNLNFENYSPGDIILWNEKVYLCCSSYLMEIEQGIKKTEISANDKINEKLNGKYNLIEFSIESLGTPSFIIQKLFNDNKQWWNKLISDNYTSGAICCFPFKNGKNMKTLIYLVQKQ
jgi:hypothetical protein